MASKLPLILITGASQGIGAAIAHVFAGQIPGVRLALVARSEKNLQRAARACLQAGATVEIFPCDVTDEGAVAAMARAVHKHFGPVDALINNAGTFTMAPFVKTTVAAFDRQIAVNLRSPFLVTQAFLPAMLQRKRGSVFFYELNRGTRGLSERRCLLRGEVWSNGPSAGTARGD